MAHELREPAIANPLPIPLGVLLRCGVTGARSRLRFSPFQYVTKRGVAGIWAGCDAKGRGGAAADMWLAAAAQDSPGGALRGQATSRKARSAVPPFHREPVGDGFRQGRVPSGLPGSAVVQMVVRRRTAVPQPGFRGARDPALPFRRMTKPDDGLVQKRKASIGPQKSSCVATRIAASKNTTPAASSRSTSPFKCAPPLAAGTRPGVCQMAPLPASSSCSRWRTSPSASEGERAPRVARCRPPVHGDRRRGALRWWSNSALRRLFEAFGT